MTMFKVIGVVSRVAGPLVEAESTGLAHMLEMVEVGDDRLVGEIVRLNADKITIQVYEDTTSLKPGAPVYGSGMPLAVELGPGLIRYDLRRDTAAAGGNPYTGDQYIQKRDPCPGLG